MNSFRALWVRARTARQLRMCVQVGRSPRVEGIATVLAMNGGRIELGDHFHLSSRPAASHLVSWGILRIGNDVSIGHGSAVAASRRVSIGDRARIGPFFVLMDTDFHGERTRVGARPTTSTAVTEESGYAPVEIGADVRIGAHVTVLRGSVIGAGATIAAGSVVNGYIPSRAYAEGVPARRLMDATRFQASETDVAAVVTRALDLSTTPDPRSGPDDIPEWDSLGALKILLSLEETFGLALDEHVVSSVSSVAELQRVVDEGRQRGQ